MEYPIEQLVKKSIIKVDEGRVKMHDLIQDMGRQKDLKNSHREPVKRRRLTLWKDIIEVLKHNKLIPALCINRGLIKLRSLIWTSLHQTEKIIEWDGNSFKKMKNLKILIIINVKFSQGPKRLLNSLRLLEWWGYPSNCLPSDFQPHKFVKCNLPNSCLTSFELDHSSQLFKNLTVLIFDQCKSLTQIPDMSDFSNLEALSFCICDKLVTVHESIGRLGKVKYLSAHGCSNLVSFPPIHLTSLEFLGLSSTVLESFPEISGKMENIRHLELSDTPIKELPISFVNLIRLEEFSMYDYGSVVKLPSSILMMPKLGIFETINCKKVKWVKEEENEQTTGSIVPSKVYILNVPNCNLNDDFFSIGFTRFADVGYLDLSGNNFTFIPECIKEFRSLQELNVDDCEHLQEIRGVPPNIEAFSAMNCKSLTSWTIEKFIDKERYEAGMKRCVLPGAWIPRWFDHQSKGPSISFWIRNEVPAHILCFKITPVLYRAEVFMNGKIIYHCVQWGKKERMELDHTFIFKIKLKSIGYKVALEKEWNHVEVKATSDCKAIGIHVWDSSEDDIRFKDPCRKRKLDDVQGFQIQWSRSMTWAPISVKAKFMFWTDISL